MFFCEDTVYLLLVLYEWRVIVEADTFEYVVCFSTPGHPFALLLHDYQSCARHCMCVAREKLTTNESAVKRQIHQAPAEDSSQMMSSIRQSLPSGEASANSVGFSLDSRPAAENITVHGDKEGGNRGDGSLQSETDSLSSSVPSSVISSDQDQDESSLDGFSVESQIARDMATEILGLLDQLEGSILATFDMLPDSSVSEDAHNMLRLVLQGFFFTHLWEDILSFYRSAIDILFIYHHAVAAV